MISSTNTNLVLRSGARLLLLCALLMTMAVGCWAQQGNVWAWGYNTTSELGNGSSPSSSPIPAQVHGPNGVGFLSGITAISSSGISPNGWTLAVKSDGTVWGWGNSGFGPSSSIPIQIVGSGGKGFLTGVSAVAVGSDVTQGGTFSLALQSNGAVWAFGDNGRGELGNGTTNNSATPVQVVGSGGSGFLTSITSISAGVGFCLAVKSNGTAWAWGDNGAGELGNNMTVQSSTPVEVVGTGGVGFFTGVMAVAASKNASFGLALKSNGTVWGWGDNGEGELGNGTTNASTAEPVQVVGAGGSGTLTGITAIAAGGDHSLALKSDGTVWAWGANFAGQLGNGDSSGMQKNAPVQVVGPSSGFLTGILAISAGYDFSLALSNNGTVWAWGDNGIGQLGLGFVGGDSYNGGNNVIAPMQVVNSDASGSLGGIAAIAAGYQNGYAVTGHPYTLLWQSVMNGDVYQWLVYNASQVAGGSILSGIPPVWKIVGTADFNGDGFADILWQNTSTGEIGYWQMRGVTYVQYVQIAAPGVVSTAWRVAGAGNLNGSGAPNILFQNSSTSEIGYWTLGSGETHTYTQLMAAGAVSTAWHIVGVPNFTGSGEANILFQNTSTSEIGYWTLASGKYSSYTQVAKPGQVPTIWRIAATPDVNGDGQSDLIFQNEMTGQINIWLMSNGQMTSAVQLSAPGIVSLDWQVSGAF